MQPTLNIALRAARIAGEQIARAIDRLDIIKSEQENVREFIEDTSRAAERSVAYTISKGHPGQPILGRYSGALTDNPSNTEQSWQINPIDGLTNFANGLPFFAISITCKLNERAEHCVILNPITGEEFTASRGRGAQLNGKRIRVSQLKLLDGALIGTDFSNQVEDRERLTPYLEMFKNISLQGGQLQSNGSPALTLAYMAAGRIDACWYPNLDDWTLDSGMLLIQEAGGLMGDFNGGNNIHKSGDLVSGNPKLFKQLLQAIRPAAS